MDAEELYGRHRSPGLVRGHVKLKSFAHGLRRTKKGHGTEQDSMLMNTVDPQELRRALYRVIFSAILSGGCALNSYLSFGKREVMIGLYGRDLRYWLEYHDFSERTSVVVTMLMLKWGIIVPFLDLEFDDGESDRVAGAHAASYTSVSAAGGFSLPNNGRAHGGGNFSIFPSHSQSIPTLIPNMFYCLSDWRKIILSNCDLLSICTIDKNGTLNVRSTSLAKAFPRGLRAESPDPMRSKDKAVRILMNSSHNGGSNSTFKEDMMSHRDTSVVKLELYLTGDHTWNKARSCLLKQAAVLEDKYYQVFRQDCQAREEAGGDEIVPQPSLLSPVHPVSFIVKAVRVAVTESDQYIRPSRRDPSEPPRPRATFEDQKSRPGDKDARPLSSVTAKDPSRRYALSPLEMSTVGTDFNPAKGKKKELTKEGKGEEKASTPMEGSFPSMPSLAGGSMRRKRSYSLGSGEAPVNPANALSIDMNSEVAEEGNPMSKGKGSLIRPKKEREKAKEKKKKKDKTKHYKEAEGRSSKTTSAHQSMSNTPTALAVGNGDVTEVEELELLLEPRGNGTVSGKGKKGTKPTALGRRLRNKSKIGGPALLKQENKQVQKGSPTSHRNSQHPSSMLNFKTGLRESKDAKGNSDSDGVKPLKKSHTIVDVLSINVDGGDDRSSHGGNSICDSPRGKGPVTLGSQARADLAIKSLGRGMGRKRAVSIEDTNSMRRQELSMDSPAVYGQSITLATTVSNMTLMSGDMEDEGNAEFSGSIEYSPLNDYYGVEYLLPVEVNSSVLEGGPSRTPSATPRSTSNNRSGAPSNLAVETPRTIVAASFTHEDGVEDVQLMFPDDDRWKRICDITPVPPPEDIADMFVSIAGPPACGTVDPRVTAPRCAAPPGVEGVTPYSVQAGSISTYPNDPNEPIHRLGDPVCDQYHARLYERAAVLVLADGCSWGLRSRAAALDASRAFVRSYQDKLSKMVNTNMIYESLLDALVLSHNAILHGKSVLETGTTTLLGGIVLPLERKAPKVPHHHHTLEAQGHYSQLADGGKGKKLVKGIAPQKRRMARSGLQEKKPSSTLMSVRKMNSENDQHKFSARQVLSPTEEVVVMGEDNLQEEDGEGEGELHSSSSTVPQKEGKQQFLSLQDILSDEVLLSYFKAFLGTQLEGQVLVLLELYTRLGSYLGSDHYDRNEVLGLYERYLSPTSVYNLTAWLSPGLRNDLSTIPQCVSSLPSSSSDSGVHKLLSQESDSAQEGKDRMEDQDQRSKDDNMLEDRAPPKDIVDSLYKRCLMEIGRQIEFKLVPAFEQSRRYETYLQLNAPGTDPHLDQPDVRSDPMCITDPRDYEDVSNKSEGEEMGGQMGEGHEDTSLTLTNSQQSYYHQSRSSVSSHQYYRGEKERRRAGTYDGEEHSIRLDDGPYGLGQHYVMADDRGEPLSSATYGFFFISVGDCKAFSFSSRRGGFSDLTPGSRMQACDPTDPGGRLGPYQGREQKPDLRNLCCYYHPCEPGDLLIIVSDGVYDNLDPEILGYEPKDFGVDIASWKHLSEVTVSMLKSLFCMKYLRFLFKVSGADEARMEDRCYMRLHSETLRIGRELINRHKRKQITTEEEPDPQPFARAVVATLQILCLYAAHRSSSLHGSQEIIKTSLELSIQLLRKIPPPISPSVPEAPSSNNSLSPSPLDDLTYDKELQFIGILLSIAKTVPPWTPVFHIQFPDVPTLPPNVDLSPEYICETLLAHCHRVTERQRKAMESGEGGKRMAVNYRQFPGKMDHTTCLVYRVPSTSSQPEPRESVTHREAPVAVASAAPASLNSRRGLVPTSATMSVPNIPQTRVTPPPTSSVSVQDIERKRVNKIGLNNASHVLKTPLPLSSNAYPYQQRQMSPPAVTPPIHKPADTAPSSGRSSSSTSTKTSPSITPSTSSNTLYISPSSSSGHTPLSSHLSHSDQYANTNALPSLVEE